MTKNTDRRQGEGYPHPEKETGRTGDNQATQNSNIDTPDSTAPEAERERGLFLPLAWAQLGGTVKPQPFRGKAKRKSRQAAINAKRGHKGSVDAGLAGLIVLALVAGLLLVGGA